jgi:hypothetical protein
MLTPYCGAEQYKMKTGEPKLYQIQYKLTYNVNYHKTAGQ